MIAFNNTKRSLIDSNKERPVIVETSKSSAYLYLFLGCGWLFISAGWFFQSFRGYDNEIGVFLKLLNFVLALFVSSANIFLYTSYSKPNIFLFKNKMKIHCFHARGNISLDDINKIVPGFKITYWLGPKNRVHCINNSLTRKNKILIKLKEPVLFKIPMRRIKKTDEVVIDVLSQEGLIYYLKESNPNIEIVKEVNKFEKEEDMPNGYIDLRLQI